MGMILHNFNIEWSVEDGCYIATTRDSDLIGCGDSPIEAIKHLQNHLKDEEETPRKNSRNPKSKR